LSIGRAVGPMGGAGSLESVFPGPSAMAALMRDRDWSSSPMGLPAAWPPSLRTACRICLTARFPVIVWWGPELRFIYNDAYLPLLGTKHPALDRPGADVWREIWPIIGPTLRGVLETGQPTRSEDLLRAMDRYGYWEETYWTDSYSPLHDDEGAVRGVFTAVTDTTERVIGQRRLSVLRNLGAQAGIAHTVREACGLVGRSLRRAQADVPYFAVYLRDDGTGPRDGADGPALACTTTGDAETETQPAGSVRWPLAEVLGGRPGMTLRDLAARVARLPSGSWPNPPTEAMVLPLPGEAGAQPIGVQVLAASAGRRLDEEYRTFMELLAGQTAGLINGAMAYQVRGPRTEELAARREEVVAALSVQLSHAGTQKEMLAAGLAELRSQWGAPRVLAAVWERGRPVALTSAPEALAWDDLQPGLKRTIESLRRQPLHVTAPAGLASGQPSGAGTAVEYAGGVAAIWIDLDGDQPFGPEDRTLLELLCGRLGQALNRARRLDQQREAALTLQHAMADPGRMPPGFAVRYQPAAPPLEAGGDWYDVAELAVDRIGIVVGDCVGRGLAAASVMGQLRSACRALLLQSEGPAQALTALDRFAALTPDALCSTVFCGILDTAAGRLTYASAGHPPAILAHADGTTELLDQGRSLSLGLSPDHPRREASAEVPHGATLLLYTNGLIERRRGAADAGPAPASALLQAARDRPVDELAEQIMTGLAPEHGYEDDVAILLYSRPAPLELAFRADPNELAPIRRELRRWLRRLSPGETLVQNVLIAVGEACANAIEHGYRDSAPGTVRLVIEVSGTDIRITVTDNGRWRAPREVPYRGNGLKVIRATMQDVIVTADDTGTTVEMRAKTP
jgi:serine phosphatase RsbU (regulator of sigma subunit)/anti-sigma regulatory factor (Ser/Thr protein kinase)